MTRSCCIGVSAPSPRHCSRWLQPRRRAPPPCRFPHRWPPAFCSLQSRVLDLRWLPPLGSFCGWCQALIPLPTVVTLPRPPAETMAYCGYSLRLMFVCSYVLYVSTAGRAFVGPPYRTMISIEVRSAKVFNVNPWSSSSELHLSLQILTAYRVLVEPH